MALLQEFLVPGGWEIEDWVADPRLGMKIGSFMKNSRLLIGQVVADPADQQLCSLAWLNADNNLSYIAGIPYDPEAGILKGEVLVQSFSGQPSIYCTLELDLKSEVVEGRNVFKRLHGRFAPAGTDFGGTGGPGTLAAQADAGPLGEIPPKYA